MSDWSDTMRDFLGKAVVVTLSTDEPVTVAGILVSFTDDGEVCVQEEDGTHRWAWPNLHIREVAS